MAKKPNIFIRIVCFLLFVILLPVLIIGFIIRAIIKCAKFRKWKREGETGRKLLLSSDITAIDLMEGYEFEEYLKALFYYGEYSVEVTQKSRDYGADLILTREQDKIVVQAKRYNKTVGSKCVAEVVGAMKHYMATEGWVVTNAHFSEQAEVLARDNGVRLIDREELIEISNEVCEKLRLNNKMGDVAAETSFSSNYSGGYGDYNRSIYNGGGVSGDDFRI